MAAELNDGYIFSAVYARLVAANVYARECGDYTQNTDIKSIDLSLGEF